MIKQKIKKNAQGMYVQTLGIFHLLSASLLLIPLSYVMVALILGRLSIHTLSSKLFIAFSVISILVAIFYFLSFRKSHLSYDVEGFTYYRWPQKPRFVKWEEIKHLESHRSLWKDRQRWKLWVHGRIIEFDFHFQSERHFLAFMNERIDIGAKGL